MLFQLIPHPATSFTSIPGAIPPLSDFNPAWLKLQFYICKLNFSTGNRPLAYPFSFVIALTEMLKLSMNTVAAILRLK